MPSEIFRYQGCFAAKALWARVQGFGNPLFISEAGYCRKFKRANGTRVCWSCQYQTKNRDYFEVTTLRNSEPVSLQNPRN